MWLYLCKTTNSRLRFTVVKLILTDPRAEKRHLPRVSPKYRIVPYGILVTTTQLLTQLTACQFNVLLVLNLHRRLVSKATYAYNL